MNALANPTDSLTPARGAASDDDPPLAGLRASVPVPARSRIDAPGAACASASWAATKRAWMSTAALTIGKPPRAPW